MKKIVFIYWTLVIIGFIFLLIGNIFSNIICISIALIIVFICFLMLDKYGTDVVK